MCIRDRVTDVRSGTNFSALFQSLEALKGMKCPYRILYMDASDDVIIKRYKMCIRDSCWACSWAAWWSTCTGATSTVC